MVSTNNNEEIDLEESYEFDPYQLLTPWDDPEAERWRIPYLAEILMSPFRMKPSISDLFIAEKIMRYETILEVIHNWAREYDVIPYNKNVTARSFEVLAEALEFAQFLTERLEKSPTLNTSEQLIIDTLAPLAAYKPTLSGISYKPDDDSLKTLSFFYEVPDEDLSVEYHHLDVKITKPIRADLINKVLGYDTRIKNLGLDFTEQLEEMERELELFRTTILD